MPLLLSPTTPMSPTTLYTELPPAVSLWGSVPWGPPMLTPQNWCQSLREKLLLESWHLALFCCSASPILTTLRVSRSSVWLPVRCHLPALEGETLESWRLMCSKQFPGSSSPHLSYGPIPACQSPTVTYSHLASSSCRKFQNHSAAWVPSVVPHSSASKPRFLIKLTTFFSPVLCPSWHWFVTPSTCPTGSGPWLAHQVSVTLKPMAGIQWLTWDGVTERRRLWSGVWPLSGWSLSWHRCEGQ